MRVDIQCTLCIISNNKTHAWSKWSPEMKRSSVFIVDKRRIRLRLRAALERNPDRLQCRVGSGIRWHECLQWI